MIGRVASMKSIPTTPARSTVEKPDKTSEVATNTESTTMMTRCEVSSAIFCPSLVGSLRISSSFASPVSVSGVPNTLHSLNTRSTRCAGTRHVFGLDGLLPHTARARSGPAANAHEVVALDRYRTVPYTPGISTSDLLRRAADRGRQGGGGGGGASDGALLSLQMIAVASAAAVAGFVLGATWRRQQQ